MRRLGGVFHRARIERRGVIAPLVAVATPVLIGFAGLAIDAAEWEATKTGMQGAADRAALAAATASQRSGGNNTAQLTEARSIAASHGFVHGKDNVQVNIGAPQSGNYASTAGALEVTISGRARLSFTSLFLNTAPTVTGRAVVAPSNMCVLALGTTGTTVSANGGGTVALVGCDLYNNSSDGRGTDQQGSGSITAQNVNLVGGASGNVTATGSLVTGVRPALDPYEDRAIPTRTTCDETKYQADASKTFAPGPGGIFKFCKGLSTQGSGTLTFNPGIYIIEDHLDLTGGTWTLKGTNVTLVFTGNMSGKGAIRGTNPTINLSSPSTGPTAGMGIWVDGGASGGDITFLGGSSVSVTGAIYAPNASVSLGGHAGSGCMQLVVRKLEMKGTSDIKHECEGVGVSDVPGSFRLVE